MSVSPYMWVGGGEAKGESGFWFGGQGDIALIVCVDVGFKDKTYGSPTVGFHAPSRCDAS